MAGVATEAEAEAEAGAGLAVAVAGVIVLMLMPVGSGLELRPGAAGVRGRGGVDGGLVVLVVLVMGRVVLSPRGGWGVRFVVISYFLAVGRQGS